jgi:glycosyltransferase involved in cell wall biosynthesis
MLAAFEALIKADPEYRLFVAGTFQELRYEYYWAHMIKEMGLTDNVFYVGFQDNIHEWLANMHYVCCSSPWESQNMSVMEAMASGCMPLVHNFPGAKQIYPAEYVWTTISDFVDLILCEPWQPERFRDVVLSSYAFHDKIKDIEGLFQEIGTSLRYGPEIKM